MARKKTDVEKWMDEVLRKEPNLAKAVDQRLDEMRREQDEAERSPEYRSRSSRRKAGPKMTEPISKELSLAAAKRLSPGSWDFLFDELFAEIEVEPDPEIEAAWLAEAERRLRNADESCWIPAEVVFAEARRTVNRPQKPRPPIVVDG